jgi:hypothetical protein
MLVILSRNCKWMKLARGGAKEGRRLVAEEFVIA